MSDFVEWIPKHHGHKPLHWTPDTLTGLDGKNYVRQPNWAWIAGTTYYVPYEAVYGVPRPAPVEEGAEVVDLLNDYQRGLLEGLEMAAGCVEEFLGGRNPMADAVRLLKKAALQEAGQ